ncbi:acyl carrier protein, partial [Mesorhizobium sp. LNHC252B00]|uniref:acyl carrier protein n=1 Tax=Mesorhizobium sp. LNHC252B00 TaxID=1287252 RepID=UPI002477D934
LAHVKEHSQTACYRGLRLPSGHASAMRRRIAASSSMTRTCFNGTPRFGGCAPIRVVLPESASKRHVLVMTLLEIEQLVLKTLNALVAEKVEVSMTTRMRDLGLDSLDYNELATAIESRLGWFVDDYKLWQYESVRHVADAVASQELRTAEPPAVRQVLE